MSEPFYPSTSPRSRSLRLHYAALVASGDLRPIDCPGGLDDDEIDVLIDCALEQRVFREAVSHLRSEGRQGSPVETPPASNTGGIEPVEHVDRSPLTLQDFLKRQEASPNAAFLDWCSFTSKKVSFDGVTDEDVAFNLSSHLEHILGFGITEQRKTGRFNYSKSYDLGNGCGILCIGGNGDTVLVSLNGYGCMRAKEGWEKRLYQFFVSIRFEVIHQKTGEVMVWPRLTRTDLARDFLEGEYPVERAAVDYHADLFSLGARMPEVQRLGNWDKPNGKGLTFQVGSRLSGKLARIYEKGKQLGRGFSELFPAWTRVELELHNKDRVIPWDVLLEPGKYLAGAYPAFEFISDEQTRVKTKKNTAKIVYDAMVNTAKHQFGKAVNAMMKVEGTAEKVVSKLFREGVPKRLIQISMETLLPDFDPLPLGAT